MERISLATARNEIFTIRPYLFLHEIIAALVSSISENFSLNGGTTEELIMTVTEKMETNVFSANDLDGNKQEWTLKEWEAHFLSNMDVRDLNNEDVIPLVKQMSSMNTQSLINYWLVASYSEDIKILSNRLFRKIFSLLFDYRTIIEEDVKRTAYIADGEMEGATELEKALANFDGKQANTAIKIISDIENDMRFDFDNDPHEKLLETGQKELISRPEHSMIIRRWVETVLQNVTEKAFNTLLSNSSMLESLLILIPEGVLLKKMMYFQLTTHHKFINYDFINARGRIEYVMDASDIYKNVLMNYIYNMMVSDNLIVQDIREKTDFEKKLNNQYISTLEGSILRPDSDKSFKRYKIQQLSDRLNKVSRYPGGVSSLIQYTSEIKYKDDKPASLDEFGHSDLPEVSVDEEISDVMKTVYPIMKKVLDTPEPEGKKEFEEETYDGDK